MARLNANDARRVGELGRSLETWTVGEPPVLGSFMPALRDLLGAQRTIAYTVGREGAAFSVSALEASGIDAMECRRIFDGWLKAQSGPWTGFNPERPEPAQRNVALGLGQVFRMIGTSKRPVSDEMFPKLGMGGWDQMRTLICDGPSLLSWIGGFRPETFRERERLLLVRLIPVLQARLRLERQLGDAAVTTAAIPAAMQAISTAAFIVSASGDVRHANSAGAQLLQQQKEAIQWLSNDVKTSSARKFALTKLIVRGAPEHFLAVLHRPARDPTRCLTAAVQRWQLTKKQSEVLRWLIHGAANKTVAAALDCAEGTIELHVTALMAKVQVKTRAELVAKFWVES